MKKIVTYIIITVIVLVAGNNAFAQNKLPTGKIYGEIADSLTKEPLGFVTISLKTAKDSLINTTLSKTDGKFIIEGLKLIKYHLAFISTGYQEKVISVDLDSGKSDLGTIYLSKQIKTLKEVEIQADRPIIQQKPDRIIYDMQADPESKVNSVLNMIHKIPFLSLDANNNVLLKGNPSFKVLINGKPSGMMDNNLTAVLRSMPASTILRIEVITIPPSKYDAEGMTGIINIITDRKIDGGYKGTLNANESFPNGGPGFGTSFTVQEGKFGINGYGGVSQYNTPQANNSNTRITTGDDATFLQQDGYNKSNSKNGYFGTELSYEIDSLNLVSGNFNINGYRNNGSSYQSSALTGADDTLQQGYDLNNSNFGNGGGVDASLNYQLGFRSDKNSLLTFSYRYTNYGNNAHTVIDISNPIDYTTPDYTQLDNQDSKEQTFQVDYVHPIKKVNIEAGVKAILRSSNSDFQYNSLNAADNQFEPDPALSDQFNYTQDVFGAYNSYQFSLKKWSFNAGLRAEETNVNANFISSGSTVGQNYFNVIPSIAVNKSFADNSSISFGFGQRIRRPGINRLNPFVDRSNPDFVTTGNPNLRPVLMNNIQLSYSNGNGKKVSVFAAVSYIFVNNLDLQVTSFDPATQITQATYQNVGKGGGVQLDFNINYSPSRIYNLSINGNVLQLFFNGTGVASADKLDRILGHVSISNGFKFDKGWSANANVDLYSASPTNLQGVTNAFINTSLSINKEVVKNKLYLSGAVNNPFTKFRSNITRTVGPDFTQVSDNQVYFRYINFSLNYSFGKLKNDIKKNRKGINNDDVSNRSGGL